MDGKIVNSRGVHVADFKGSIVYGLGGEPMFSLKGRNIYRLSGELVPDHACRANERAEETVMRVREKREKASMAIGAVMERVHSPRPSEDHRNGT